MVLTARGVCCELLKALSEDLIIPLSQNEDNSSYFSYPDELTLDFSKSAEENYALIRAVHPWGETLFYNNMTALTPTPFTTFVEHNQTEYTKAGTITEINAKNKTVSVVCGDGKILKMINLNLYTKCDRPFTKNYIKRELNVGDLLV